MDRLLKYIPSSIASSMPSSGATRVSDDESEGSREAKKASNRHPSTVFLNVYDLNHDMKGANKLLRGMETGLYHTGIEVFGKEYAYGGCDQGSGISVSKPRKHSYHVYKKTHILGITQATPDDIPLIIKELKKTWRGADYHLYRHNCVSFALDLSSKLGFAPSTFPRYINSLMNLGQKLDKVGDKVGVGEKKKMKTPRPN